MTISEFLKHHPSLLFAEDMRDIAQPLLKLGIDYFSHVRINANNEMTANASNPDYFQFYFNQGYHQSDLHIARFDVPQRYVLWHMVEREGKAEELYQSGIEFGLFYIFSIVEYSGDEKNYYHFAAQSGKTWMNEFYFHHIDLLENFVAYYKHCLTLNDRLNRAYQLPLKIRQTIGTHMVQLDCVQNLPPENIRDFLQSIAIHPGHSPMKLDLSRREMQCALYLLDGKTSVEIATLLHLSPRTVEVYFDRLKARFGSKNKLQLVRHLLESGLF